MHLRELTAIATVALAVAHAPAQACSRDPFLFQLPGETEAEAHERSDRIGSDFAIIALYERERRAFEQAQLIYLARVLARTAGSLEPGRDGPSATVRPLTSLKGTLPSSDRTLVREVQPGACTDYGDGLGAISPVGALVVVFEGLPKTRERRRGIDSLQVSSVRSVQLLDKLREYGKDLEP